MISFAALDSAAATADLLGAGPPTMPETGWNPACSFCGARPPAELVRAGGRDYWICSHCIDEPVIEDRVVPDAVCTFCEKSIRRSRSVSETAERQVVAARRGVVLCNECVRLCAQIIAEDRARRAQRPR